MKIPISVISALLTWGIVWGVMTPVDTFVSFIIPALSGIGLALIISYECEQTY